MDDSELVKAGMEVMLRPVTEITENALGLAGGDWLSEKRARNRAKLKAKTEEILKARGAELDTDPSPSVVMPLLSAAQDEGREELLALWAALLAAASDPARRSSYRREFVEIIRQLEPTDAAIFGRVGAGRRASSDSIEKFAAECGLSLDQLIISGDKLSELGLINPDHWGDNRYNITPTPLAREVFRVVSD